MRQSAVDTGVRTGTTSDETAELRRLRRENAELKRQRYFEGGVGFLRGRARPALPLIAEFIRAHADHREPGGLRWGVEPICAVLTEHLGMRIVPSTYYGHAARPLTHRLHVMRDAELLEQIRRVHKDNNDGTYGARKVWLQLNREGVPAARWAVERLMRQAGLVGVHKGKSKRTTVPDAAGQRAGDLVGRRFAVLAPDRLWVADITYISTWSGWVYVALVTDAYARRIVGWRVGTTMTTQLVLDALEQAIWTRQRAGQSVEHVVAHSDRGSQYTSIRYTELLADAGIAASIGSVGDSYDNALAEAVTAPKRPK